ncbi:MAG: Rnase Y domain-containing protein, partial [Mucinivorans sp.]
MEIIIYSLLAVLVTGVATFVITNKATSEKRNAILKKAEEDAEMIRKEKALSAKERFIQLKAEHDRSINERNNKVAQIEAKIKSEQIQTQKEAEALEKSKREFESTRNKVEAQIANLAAKNEEVAQERAEQIKRLEQIASLSAEEAKAQIIEQMKVRAESEAMVLVNDIIEEAKLTASKDAKKIVIQTIQRVATEAAVENSVTVFNIDSDEVKGRIIGREGRNIRALEAATGVEIVVDDTPEAIILSGFDPIRREIARLSLHQLVTDGRIHPARIEEVVTKVTAQIEEEIVEV